MESSHLNNKTIKKVKG